MGFNRTGTPLIQLRQALNLEGNFPDLGIHFYPKYSANRSARALNVAATYGEAKMYLDHPIITATHSNTEPDRLERLNRVYGYAVGLADQLGNKEFIRKLAQLHDDRGNLIVFWASAPTETEKTYLVRAWASLIGDGTQNVTHEMQQTHP